MSNSSLRAISSSSSSRSLSPLPGEHERQHQHQRYVSPPIRATPPPESIRLARLPSPAQRALNHRQQQVREREVLCDIMQRGENNNTSSSRRSSEFSDARQESIAVMGGGGGKAKEREKERDKEGKRGWDESDFAYEYVPVSQVRIPFFLSMSSVLSTRPY